MASLPARAWMTGLAWVNAALGRTDEARDLVERLTRDDLAALRLDANWHAVLDFREALALLDGFRPRAERLYEHLGAVRGPTPSSPWAVLWYGPVDHYLGLLVLTAGDPARRSATWRRRPPRPRRSARPAGRNRRARCCTGGGDRPLTS